MQSRIKFGLIVGVVGLALNVCVSAFLGICGPVVSLIGGALAGFLAVQGEKPATKGEGARVGATSGAIAGGLILLGQLLGAIASLVYVQFSGMKPPFGTIPAPSADAAQQMIYYLSGLGTGFCIGLVGVALAALGGAGTGYMGTPDRPQPVPLQ